MPHSTKDIVMDDPTGTDLMATLIPSDAPSPPEIFLSCIPPSPSHYLDPFWWDQAGNDAITRRHIFTHYSGTRQAEKLAEVFDEFPDKKQRVLVRAASEGRVDVLRILFGILGAGGVGVGGVEERARKRDDQGCVVDGEFEDEDEDESEKEVFSPLCEAAIHGQFEAVKVLVEEGGCDVDQRDDQGGTALVYALRYGFSRIVRYLLEKGADPTIRVRDMNIVQHAAIAGDVELLQMFMQDHRVKEAGIDSSFCPELLDEAAYSGNTTMIRHVLHELGYPDDKGDGSWAGESLTLAQRGIFERAVRFALQKSHLDATKLLLSYLTPRDPNDPTRFQYYRFSQQGTLTDIFNNSEDIAEANNVELIDLLADTFFREPPPDQAPGNISYNESGPQGWMPRRLMSAAPRGALDVVKLLLEKYNTNINHISHKYHGTALFSAAAQGKVEVVEYLLERGADVHIGCGKYANGPTALHNAIRNGNSEVVKVLLRRGGGPIEELNEDVEKIFDEGKVFAVAVEKYRAPVYLLSPSQLEEFEKKIAETGEVFEKMPIDLDEGATEWISNLKIRKRDEVLKETGDLAREMMEEGDVDAVEESRYGEEPPAKKRRRLYSNWLKDMGLAP